MTDKDIGIFDICFTNRCRWAQLGHAFTNALRPASLLSAPPPRWAPPCRRPARAGGRTLLRRHISFIREAAGSCEGRFGGGVSHQLGWLWSLWWFLWGAPACPCDRWRPQPPGRAETGTAGSFGREPRSACPPRTTRPFPGWRWCPEGTCSPAEANQFNIQVLQEQTGEGAEDPNLEDFLDATGDIVVLGTNDVGVHDTGGGVQRVDGGVDAQLGDGTRQYSGGVQVSEGGGRGGVSQVISGHVDGLRSRRHSASCGYPGRSTRKEQLLTCTDVMEPFLVVVILSCMVPMSVARVGWYPTAEGIRPSRADTFQGGKKQFKSQTGSGSSSPDSHATGLTSEPAWVKRKMLSMKSSTSWPSWSRKYSATVSPVRATLARAPGGSFIWPYTSAT